jgi:xanthomonalisin
MRNSKYVLRQATLVAAMVAALGAMSAGDVSAATQSTAIPANRARISEPASLRPGDVIDGMLANTTAMHVTIGLSLRNRAQLDSFIQSNASVIKTSHEPMSNAQFMANHAPTDAQVKAVTDFLSSAGFTHIEVAPNHLLIEADGRADLAQAAFQTSFARVRTADGRDAYANTEAATIPAALQGTVLTVMGLQNVWKAHTMMQKATPGPITAAITGHNPTEFSSIYGGTGVATAAGVNVGIITQGKITQTVTDLNTFTSNNGLATVTTQTVQVGSASNDTSGIGEWDLDSQDIVGMGGGQVGKIIFYNINSLSDANLISGFNKAVTDNVAKVINVSIGGCETGTQSGAGAEGDNVFAQAVAQGQTFTISTGDSGADECGTGGTVPSWPANSQYVVAVAGTKLDASTTTWNSEVVWNDLSINNGATGGSQSTYEPKPSWQTLWTGQYRGVADVAFDGSPSSGAKVIVSGATQQIGGTSLSAPLFAGMWARVIATKGTSVGFAGPIIYQLPAADFHDVTSGNNNGSTAGVGYDLASGRGSMILNKAINDIGGTTPPANVPPVANFGVTTSGLTATFTDSSTDSDGTIASRSWNFGDSSTSTSANPSHTYAAAGTYSVSLTVTDNSGASNTKTSSVTVSSGGSGGNVLQNGVAATGLSGATNGQLAYTMVVPAGATGLKFVTSGGSGDADLYVKFGSAPTTSSYDCRSWNTGNSETCSITTAQAGTYYVMINGYSAFSGLSLTGSYSTGGGTGGGTTLSNGVAVTGLSASTGNWTSDYTLVVPSGATNLKFAISGGTGDADMYVRLGSAPTTSSYTCRPYVSGNSETCTFAAPTAGTYHVSLRAYSTFSGVTLTPSYTP